MNSSKRKYFDKFGFMFKKYFNNGGLFGARYFAFADEYYFNDKLVDVSFSVGINIGKFKSQISRRAEIELTLYIKDTLKILDMMAIILHDKAEYKEFSKKAEYRKNYNEVVLTVEGVLGLKKISDTLYRLGIVYREPNTNEIIEYSVVELDKYDLLELHNMLRTFTQTSYNIMTQLGIQYSTKNTDKIISKQDTLTQGISNISTNAEIIDENINLDELNFELKVPSISVDIEHETVIKESNIDIPEIEEINETSSNDEEVTEVSDDTLNDISNSLMDDEDDDDNDEAYNDYQQKMNTLYKKDDDHIDESEEETIIDNDEENEGEIKEEYNEQLSEIVTGLEKAGVTFSNVNNYPIIENIPDNISQFFYSKLHETILHINSYGLSSIKIKPAFILLLLNHNIKEFIHQNNLINKGLYDILQSLFLINKTKSDEPMFNKFNTDMINERIENYLEKHDQMINNKDNDLYISLLKSNF